MDEQAAQGEINKKPSKAKIDPLNLLECLKILLSNNGGIKDVQSVHRLVVLMGKYSKKLVSKCMYLNILLATDRHILDTFFKDGGWKMVSEWLCEGIKKCNWPLAGLVLELLRASPITLERLNDSDLVMVKQVKSLSVSCPHTGVSEAAKLLVQAWTRMLTAATASDALTPAGESHAPAAHVLPTGPPKPDPAAVSESGALSALKLEDADEQDCAAAAVKCEATDDGFGAMHQEPILPKYIPTKKPKFKNRSKFAVAKRFKSKSLPVSAESDEHTAVVRHALPVLVVSPLPRAYIEHVAGVGGRPSSVLGRRGRKRGQRTRQTPDSSSGESESRSESPQKPIKIIIKSGPRVLAQVSSKKAAPRDEAATKTLSKEYIDTDDDDQDDDEDEDVENKQGSKRTAESDEDFVVEEWNEKSVAGKLNRSSEASSKAMRAGIAIKKSRKRACRVIESDDSMDSLPNIEQEDARAEGGAHRPAVVNGDAQVPPCVATKLAKLEGALQDARGEAEAVAPKHEIKLKKFSLARAESGDSVTAADKKPARTGEEERERSRHGSSSSSSGGKKSTKDKEKERSRGDDKDKNKFDRSKSDEKRKEKDRKNSVSGEKERKWNSGSSSISREREKERERENSGSSSISREREREKRKEKERRERRDQLEKDRSTLEKVKPLSTDGLAKIPKKPPSFLDALGSADAGESQIKKPPVKVKSSSFRSTGLLEATAPRPPGVAGKRLVPPGAPPAAPAKTNANGAAWPGPPPPPRGKAEAEAAFRPAKRPLDLPPAGGADKRVKSTISSTPLTGDRPGGAKLISPKRPSLSDDGGFMAALDACSPKEGRRLKFPQVRRPRRPSDAEKAEDAPEAGGGSPSAVAPAAGGASPGAPPPDTPAPLTVPPSEDEPALQRPPLNFYRDALEDLPAPDTRPASPTEEEAAPAVAAASEGSDASEGGDAAAVEAGLPEEQEKEDAVAQEENMDISSSASPEEQQPPYEKVEVTFAADGARPVKSALVLVRRPGPKKAVRFRPEEALEKIHYFELDQTERVNVNAQKFQDMLLLEKHGERDALDKHRGRPQTCVQLGPWQLLPVHLPEGAAAAVVPGYKSLERHVQDKRQYSTMPTFFPPNRLPDTPQEPDPEPAPARTEPPKDIPLTDTAGQDNVKNLKHIPWPEPVLNPPPQGPFFGRHPQAPHWPRPMGGPPPNYRPNGGPEYFGPPMDGMPMGSASDPLAGAPSMGGVAGAVGGMGGPSGGGGGGHWVVGSATAPPHLPKPADGPMFPGSGGPMMAGPGGYGHPPMGPMPPMPHPGYGPPPGGGWGGRMDEGERGPFRDGGWRRGGGGPRGRGWGRGGRPVSKTPCRHFLKGGCRNGDDCGFAHTLP